MCKKSDNGVKRCMIPLCGKFYHNDCIASFSATQPHNKGFRCPLHVCLSCHITNPQSNCSKGLLRSALGSMLTQSTLYLNTFNRKPEARETVRSLTVVFPLYMFV